jgi:CheY-like chemotaxis protein
VVLLDLNMPRLGGHDFLTEIRNEPKLEQTVVFVLTTSSADEDRYKAYKKNIAGYIVKNEAGKGFVEAIKMLGHFWQVVTFPNAAA